MSIRLTWRRGESFAKDMSISLGARIDQMYVKVMDQEGREAASKRLKLNVSMETAELFVGILSDTPDRLQYLNGVGVNYSTLRTRTIEMSARTLPSQEMELDQLDVLLISNFDTGTLSGDQVKAVWEWVSKGGVLLLGTGERAEDVMRAFGDDLLLAPLPMADLQEINMGVEFAKDSPKGGDHSPEMHGRLHAGSQRGALQRRAVGADLRHGGQRAGGRCHLRFCGH